MKRTRNVSKAAPAAVMLAAILFLAAAPCLQAAECQPACPMQDCAKGSTRWTAPLPCCCETPGTPAAPAQPASGDRLVSQSAAPALLASAGAVAPMVQVPLRAAGAPSAGHVTSDLFLLNTALLI